MNRLKYVCSMFLAAAGLTAGAAMTTGCDNGAGNGRPDAAPDAAPEPDAGAGLCAQGALRDATWRDLGIIDTVTPRTITVLGDEVLLGTTGGLWRRSLDEDSDWQRSGLEGSVVHSVVVLDPAAGRLVASLGAPAGEMLSAPPFAVSSDAGMSWTRTGQSLAWDDAGETRYDEGHDIAVAPGDVLFANMSGQSIARSTDAGQSWMYASGEPAQLCYACRLLVPAGDPTAMYQGCECPLDRASIRRYDIADPAAAPLDSPTTVLSADTLGNRRINTLDSRGGAPARVYAGVEGGMLWLQDGDWDWVYFSPQGSDGSRLYTYVTTIWEDPCDAAHLVFGGGEQGFNDVISLYETFDLGDTLDMPAPPPALALDQPRIEAGAQAGAQGQDLLLAISAGVDEQEHTRVLLRQHQPVQP